MLINNINENSLEKVSGAGGARWTEDEKNALIDLIKSGNYYTPSF